MALHSLKIVVVDGGSVRGTGDSIRPNKPRGKKEDDPNDPRNSKLYKFLNYNDTIKGKMKKAGVSPMSMMGIMGGVGLAKQVGRQWLNFYLSDVGRRHGDSNYQAIVGRRMEIAGDVMSVGGGALAGAAGGAMFGPWGAAIGAVVGASAAAISIGFRQADRRRSYQHQMFEYDNSQAYGLARANFSALTGRVR